MSEKVIKVLIDLKYSRGKSRDEYDAIISPKLINFLRNKIDLDSTGKSRIIFLGDTKIGKTTLLDILIGDQLYLKYSESDYKIVNEKTGVREIGEDSSISKTTAPNVYIGEDFVYYDTAGLFDSRGIEQKIVNAGYMNTILSDEVCSKLVLLVDESDVIKCYRKRNKRKIESFVQINYLWGRKITMDWGRKITIDNISPF